jgi:hypothetical protein
VGGIKGDGGIKDGGIKGDAVELKVTVELSGIKGGGGIKGGAGGIKGDANLYL